VAQNLTPREERILFALLREFAETRHPVDSRRLTEASRVFAPQGGVNG